MPCHYSIHGGYQQDRTTLRALLEDAVRLLCRPLFGASDRYLRGLQQFECTLCTPEQLRPGSTQDILNAISACYAESDADAAVITGEVSHLATLCAEHGVSIVMLTEVSGAFFFDGMWFLSGRNSIVIHVHSTTPFSNRQFSNRQSQWVSETTQAALYISIESETTNTWSYSFPRDGSPLVNKNDS